MPGELGRPDFTGPWGTEGEIIWGGKQYPHLFPPCSWKCCRLTCGRVEDEWWVGAPTRVELNSTLQPRTQFYGGYSLPMAPSTQLKVLFCKASRSVAAQAPVLVGIPPIPTPAHPWPLPSKGWAVAS